MWLGQDIDRVTGLIVLEVYTPLNNYPLLALTSAYATHQ